jgi:Family of unknown function (DUF5988)
MTTTAKLPNALLKGGPAQLDHAERIRHVEDIDQRVKLQVGNGYEHFAPNGETVESEHGLLRVFQWEHRTRIAE